MIGYSSCTTSKPPLFFATTIRPIPSSKSTLSPASISYIAFPVSNAGPNCISHGGIYNRLGPHSRTSRPNTHSPRPDDPIHICVHSCPLKPLSISPSTPGTNGDNRRSLYGKPGGCFAPSSLPIGISIDRAILSILPLGRVTIVREGISWHGGYAVPGHPRGTHVVKATGRLMGSENMNTFVCATTIRP
ncbi:hypothetical protein BDR07DRAFT_1393231 [Suillus spraguei]|nr:hypothetical protein BDR07DRAFT_1393231 [Suillus spraguei]